MADAQSYRHFWHKVADTVGNGTGSTVASGDYSSVNRSLLVNPTDGLSYEITRIIWSCVGTTMTAAKYGARTALSKGVVITVEDNSGVVDTLTAYPILDNQGWATHCHDRYPTDFGAGIGILTVRWTFAKSGVPVRLINGEGKFIRVLLQDNFTGVGTQRFMFQGSQI